MAEDIAPPSPAPEACGPELFLPEFISEPAVEAVAMPALAPESEPEPEPAPTPEAEEPQLLLTAPELALLLSGPEPTPLLAAPVAPYEDDTHFPLDPDEADRTFVPLADAVVAEPDAEHAHLTPVQRAAARRKALAQKRAEGLAAAAVDAPEETIEAASDEAHAGEPDLGVASDDSDDEPDFVRRARVHERAARRRRILMAVGSVILLLALLWQALTTFRDVLAARFPQLRPAIEASCTLLHCRIELPMQIDELSVETGELQTLNPTTLAYVTLLRNNGAIVQAWPHLELTLTDANDRPLLRRVLAPAEYLPAGAPAARGFAPASEQPVKLYFTLDQIKASGYRIAIFYP
ncbi:DUF3426 domain-containing protein [Massilia glaciei]|uniref:DUF3426 domain-containing protein n=1 Tax=Massilia glaciei TaxID=1524097 RepID=UPI00351CD4E6